MISKSDAAIELLRRRQARKLLLPFVEYTHHNWRSGEHHRVICDALEAVERGGIRRLMIFAPPRHSKSELASRRFVAWYMGRNPDRQVISCSYSDELATDIGRDVRNLVIDQRYRNVFPSVALSADSQAAGRWHTNSGGVYISTGVGGPITGRGAHLGVVDDPIKNREDADSRIRRESVWRWYTSTFYTRLMPDSAIVVMLTRWHEDDLAARALNAESWHVVNLPAVSQDSSGEESALWPEWYPLQRLHEIRSVIGPRDWAALYQQQPRTEDGTYCRRSWFDESKYGSLPAVNTYMASDLAVTEPSQGNDPDSTEHGVFGVSAVGDLYVRDWWHGQTTADKWFDAGLDLVERYKPITWFLEGGVIRRAVEPFLVKRMRERGVHCRIEWVNPIRDKATRGRSFQARASMGKIRFEVDSVKADRVIDQCVSFPSGKDDAFDVMSTMCLVIDQAHPALAKPATSVRERDGWADKPGDRGGWKVI